MKTVFLVVLWLAGVSAVPGAVSAQEEAEVRIRFSDPDLRDVGTISFRIQSLDDVQARPRFPSLSSEETLLLPHGRLRIEARVPGFWIQDRTVVVGDGHHQSLEFQARREGVIKGCFSGDGEGSRIRLQLRPLRPSDKDLGDPIEITCEPPVDGCIACGVPEGLFDLVVRPKGVVPHYLWTVGVRPGETTDVGDLTLTEGASVAGVVVGADRGAEAHLTMTADRRVSATRAVLPNGFFQFAGVPPGHFLLEIRDGRHAPARVGPIEVFEKAETRLREPLRMLEAARLDVAITPPVDEHGGLWRLILVPEALAERQFESIVRATANPAGTAEFTLRPGEYRLTLVDSGGHEPISKVVTLREGDLELQTLSYEPVAIRGRVVLGAEPVSARLVFGGEFGTRRIAIDAGEDGRFRGRLPEPGEWKVTVKVPSHGIDTDVRVEVNPDEDVKIEIPGGKISGKVLSQSGRPVAGASTVAAFSSGYQRARTDPEGRFELTAVPEGDVMVGATVEHDGQQLRTKPHYLSVQHGQSISDVVLQLEATKKLHTRIHYRGRPVANARLRLVTVEGPSYTGLTDVDGTLVMEVGSDVSGGVVTIQAPGFGFAVRAATVEDEVLTFELTRETGSIEISRPDPATGFRQISSITVGSLPIPVGDILDWARLNGSPMHASVAVWPSLEVGTYRLCATRSPERKPSLDCRTAVVTNASTASVSFEFKD
jgi:hypothetical protein